MGLRRRVSVGFMGIVGVLVLAGMVSFFELNTLSGDTENILGTNRRYKLFSSEMTSALRDNSVAFVQMTAFGERSYDSLCVSSLVRLDTAVVRAREESLVPEYVDSIALHALALRGVVEQFMTAPKYDSKYDILKIEFPRLDSLSKSFGRRMFNEYRPIYDKIVESIEFYESESQSSLMPAAEKLHDNAYRAVTPVLISLTVMIVIVLMLYYFMMLYCVVPVVKMSKSIKDYIAFKVPFAPKGERHDEMQELYEGIEVLVKQSKITKE